MVNLNQCLKQAQSIQKKIQQMQDQMASTEYFGKAGGGLVNITVTGCGKMRKISIDSSLLQIGEKVVLEDLIVTAFNDARHKVNQESQNSMSTSFGNMELSPELKI